MNRFEVLERIFFLVFALRGRLFYAHEDGEIDELPRKERLADIEIGQQLSLILAKCFNNSADECLIGGIDHAHDYE